MHIDDLISSLLADPIDELKLDASWSDGDIEMIVQRLKDEADRHWYIDPNDSLQYAEKIIAIGHYYENPSHIALGMMSKGDALRYLAKYDNAWELLIKAGELFLEINDEVGWARTCIGRLAICIQVDKIDQAKSDAGQALQIFLDHQDYDKYARMLNNLTNIHMHQSQFDQVIGIYSDLSQNHAVFNQLSPERLNTLYTNVGYAYFQLGDLQRSKYFYSLALDIDVNKQNALGVAIGESNIASIDMYQGRYRQALASFHHNLPKLKNKIPEGYIAYMIDKAVCYENLNRFEDVIDICHSTLKLARQINYPQGIARLLALVANAYSHLQRYELATIALEESSAIYTDMQAWGWQRHNHLKAAEIEYLQDHIESAQDYLNRFLNHSSSNIDLKSCEAQLLQARISIARNDFVKAISSAQIALANSKHHRLLTIRHQAHLILGNIYHQLNQPRRAMRHFLAATLATDKLQHQLTLAMRSSLITDKVGAFHHLINYHLESGAIDDAFFHLQRIKTQVWFGFLANLDEVTLANTNQSSIALSNEINTLRYKHHSLYQKIYQPYELTDDPVDPEKLGEHRKELVDIESKLRDLLEQISLQSNHRITPQRLPTNIISQTQSSLARGDVLIEFYIDGQSLYAFILTPSRRCVVKLKPTLTRIQNLIHKLQFNIDCALRAANPQIVSNLTTIANKLSDTLYKLLFPEIESIMDSAQRLYIVPYGILHYLPFQILSRNKRPLIHSHEIVILPFSGFLLQEKRQYPDRSIVLANDWEGQLHQAFAEADMIASVTGVDVLTGEQCNRHALDRMTGRILHIATHSEFRLDQPDLSYIYLDDGHLFSTDLLQNGLRFELVVLSSCEAGRAHVTSADDLVGLGHAFLYSGTESIVASLWRVDEESTYELMNQFYSHLIKGVSKSVALRSAQLDYHTAHPDTHPAFWGAFQLLGNPQPLISRTY